MKKSIMGILGAALFCFMMAASAGAADDGTITDGNLVWLKDANCFGRHSWNEISSRANILSTGSCGLSDKSTAGQWRLPTTQEMLVRYGNKSGFKNIKDHYWTSTVLGSDASKAYLMDMIRGYAGAYSKMDALGFGWPVRDK